MATALISALTKRPVSRDVAMTGEITLRGRVLPIGGLKEKCLAAFRAGIRTIIVPDRNEKDLDEIPKALRRKLNWVVAQNMSDVLKSALLNKSPAKKPVKGVEKVQVRHISSSKGSEKPVPKNRRERSIPLRP